MNNETTDQSEAIRQRTLKALAGNRAPGFHFAGYFLELDWPRIAAREATQTMAIGPHCVDPNGEINPAPLGVMVDGALATAARLGVESGARLATVNLTLQYTGHPANTDLSMDATLEGHFTEEAVSHALTRGVLSANGKPVLYASGTFVMVPPPPNVPLAPLPWQQQDFQSPQPLARNALNEDERAVLRRANTALARSDDAFGFIQRFWGVMPVSRPGGASCRVSVGGQIGNRVRHVQGGILLGLAQATASAAVPRHPYVSTLSAWYISPGRGKSLNVRSKVVHAGRSFAVVKTEVRNADRALVLETVSNHAARLGEMKSE